MSSEIVPFPDGSDPPSSGKGKAAVEDLTDSDAISQRRLGAMEEGARPFDLLGLRSVESSTMEVNLIGDNHYITHFLPPEKGPKCRTQLNPTLQSLEPLLRKMKEPSVLHLRGCDQLFVQEASPFPFEKFKTLTCLEISGVSNLTTLPENTISEMNQLQALNLSHLPIHQLPTDFFSNHEFLRSLTLKDCPNIHSLPKLPPLSALELSHLLIQQLPTDFFSCHKFLRSLTLKDCPNMHSLPEFPYLVSLKYLELSHLLIETLPVGCFSNLRYLKRVILKGCSKLRFLPPIRLLEKLQVLDLSHCTALQELQVFNFTKFDRLWKLDLSYTAFHFYFKSIPGDISNLTHLFLRDAKLVNLEGFSNQLFSLKVLDISGAQYVKDLHLLKGSRRLEALDISRTGIESIDFISGLVFLQYLILRECTRLQKLPAMDKLIQLKVLDISGCEILCDLPEDISSLKKMKELNLSGCSGLKELSPGLFDEMTCLEKLDLSRTNINHLPSFANLTNLRTLNISQTSVEEVPDSSNLISLTNFFFLDCQKSKGVAADLRTLTNLDTLDQMSRMENLHPTRRLEGRLSKPNEFYIVSTFFIKSGFDRFKQNFDRIVDLISRFQENLKPVSSLDTPTIPTAMNDADYSETTNAASCHINRQTVKRDCGRMVADLKYIRDNIGFLESCHNCTRAGELLDELTDARNYSKLLPSGLCHFNFRLDLTNFYEVLRTVAKLKLLVSPKQVDALENKEKFKSGSSYDKQEDVGEIDINTPEMQNLSRSYDSLTNIQKKCLLYFTVFTRSASIKERILIHLWYGEGFIDPQHEENVALSNANSTINPPPTPNQNLNLYPTAYSNPNPDIKSISKEVGPTRNDANRVSLQVSTAKGVEATHAIEEIGRKILMVLRENGFIDNDIIPINPPTKIWSLIGCAHSFVRARAKAEYFFNFDHGTRMLTPHFTDSQRACLLQSQDNLPSSCKLWGDYLNSSEKLESFKTIRTLLNVNQPVIDIRAEWFSKMRNLSVLHLGRWDFYEIERQKAIEVVDLKFLKEMKNMKQLRLLSLEGFSTIKKLPDSVCNLTNLKTLNLRDCCYLEKLPAGIGSLKNLTHLDLTDCRILTMLPKGIRLLSKLEVLRGFVITYHIGGRQHRNACTLMELLKLEKLRKLNLVVYTENFPFPDSSDLQVFNGMKNLCSLQIIWQQNYNNLNQQQQDVIEQKALRQHSSRWQTLKCWEQQRRQNDTEELLRSNLKKLDLCCFPFETAPNWLQPSGLQKLEKLYVRGGKLTTLVGDTSQNTWSVNTLVLESLPNMCMNEEELMRNFPHLTDEFDRPLW